MSTVTIVDSRKKWQINEDRQYQCFVSCKYFTKCNLKCYIDCTKNGGTIIPRMRGFKDERVLQKYSNN